MDHDWLRLSFMRGLGPRDRRLLLEAFPDPATLFRLDERTLRHVLERLVALAPEPDKLAIDATTARRLLASDLGREADDELERIRAHGLTLWTPPHPNYPALLAEVDDPPLVLTAVGSLARVPERTVAIVGSRKAQGFELRVARELARDLASHGVVVASGLARGIDRAAHEGALEAPEGRTVAVLGNGLARVYPSDHAELASRIRERGALVSELPVDASPRKGHFPRRNRVVSGIAAATIVVAATDGSGALITANHANDQHREVFAVPGRLDNPLARGTNLLLRDSRAHVLEGADDVLLALGWKKPVPGRDPRPPLWTARSQMKLPGVPGEVEQLLASGDARSFEDLAAHGKFEPRSLVSALGRLQSLGRVRERGGLYELNA